MLSSLLPPNKVQTPSSLTAMFEDFRSTITCKICFRLLYQPFTIACGHTYCYTCLDEWFGRNEARRKTCPDCRAVVRQQPAPAYTVREITQKYIQQPGVLLAGETKAEHERMQAEESAQVEAERSSGGLFKGIFLAPGSRAGAPPLRIIDAEDGVKRCPYCTWEIEEGDGPICHHCGREHEMDESDDGSYDSQTSYDNWREADQQHPTFVSPFDVDNDYEDEVDEDDMYDDERVAALHPDMALGEGYLSGEQEAYYINSDQEDNEDVREVVRLRRQRPELFREPPRRPIGRNIYEQHDHDHAEFSEMESEGEGEDLYPGDQMPIRRRPAQMPRWERRPHGDDPGTPHYDPYTRTLSRQPNRRRMIESDEEEDDSDTEGSLQNFVVEDEVERSVSDSEDDSSHVSNEGGHSVTVSIDGEGEEESGNESGSSFDESHMAVLPVGRGGGRVRRRVVESESDDGEGSGSEDEEEDSEDDHVVRVIGSGYSDEEDLPPRRRRRVLW